MTEAIAMKGVAFVAFGIVGLYTWAVMDLLSGGRPLSRLYKRLKTGSWKAPL